jgi:cation:H+ antiporter
MAVLRTGESSFRIEPIRNAMTFRVGTRITGRFDPLGVLLSLSAVVLPPGIAVSGASLRFDVPVVIATAVACLSVFHAAPWVAR